MGAQVQDQLVLAAQQALLEAKFAASGKPNFQALMVDSFNDIIDTYGSEAAYAARDYVMLDYAERGEVLRPAQIDLAAPVLEQTDSAARWAVYGADGGFEGEALSRLQGSLTRLVLQPYRDTVLDTVRDHGRRTRTAVARVPEVGACAFCRMLASRGAVYGSEQSAQVRKDGKSYHDSCRCSTQIAFVDGSDLPKSVRSLGLEWEKFASETDALTLKSYERWLKEGRAQ